MGSFSTKQCRRDVLFSKKVLQKRIEMMKSGKSGKILNFVEVKFLVTTRKM